MQAGTTTIRIDMEAKETELWWPHGHGEPALHDLHVAAERVTSTYIHRTDPQTGHASATCLRPHIVHIKIGFRELKVVTRRTASAAASSSW